MRTKRMISAMLILLVLLMQFGISVSADKSAVENDEPVLRYSNVSDVFCDFYIVNGTAYTYISYTGLKGITTRAEVSIKLQHQFLFWWFDVSGGEWHDTVYGVDGSANHSLALSSGGNYRAVITVKVYGTGSAYDEINQTLTDSN